jgi:hypothetical protein
LARDSRRGRIFLALSLLRDAWEATQDLGLHAEEFAVEAKELRSVGLTSTELRWLVAKGYADHLGGARRAGRACCSGRGSRSLTVAEDGCLVVTTAGLRFVTECVEGPGEGPVTAGPSARLVEGPARYVPRWDGAVRQLLWDGRLVKRFRVPAANQEVVLAALEEQGWPGRIDDPLPPSHDIDPRVRLHDTIKALNRNQVKRLLGFQGDGTGRGVIWRPLARK